jgi:acyl-CoA synthetase (AMP-forming)/AMP-acid ligase II/pimeloyl-ACP methyl ester carboxylesterase
MRKCIEILAHGLRLRGVVHLPDSKVAGTFDGLGVIVLHPGFLPRSAQADSAIVLADTLARNGIQTVRIDLPGLGDSEGDLPEDSFTFIDQVQEGGFAQVAGECVDQVRIQLGWKKVIIGGHCGGAITGFFALASRNPDWLDGLFALDVIYYLVRPMRPPVRSLEGAVIQEAPGLRREVLRNEIRLAVLSTPLGGPLQKLAQRAREFVNRFRPAHSSASTVPPPQNQDQAPAPTALPAEANFKLLKCIEQTLSRGLPVLFVSAEDPTKPSDFDYMRYVLSRGPRNAVHREITGTDHGFISGNGKSRVSECVLDWIASEFSKPIRHQVRAANASFLRSGSNHHFMNVADLMISGGRDSSPAVLSQDGVLTYGELRQWVAQVSGALLGRGHVKGDRIGIVSENSPFFVSAYLGIIRAGMVAVPFQTDLPAATLAEIVQSAGIQDLLVSERFANRLGPWAEASGVCLLSGSNLKEAEQGSETPMPGVDPARDIAALMFTSGSTGAPKGVMVSHENIACNTRDIITYLGLNSEDRVMVVLPFHYCFGVSLLHTHLMAGGAVVLNNNFKLFPEVVLKDMVERGCTGFAGVPSTYQILLRKSRFREMQFPRLKWFQQAGGKLPNPQIAEVLGSFPQVRFFLMYGQTEGTARLSYLPPEQLADKLGSIGRGLPSTSMEVLRPDGTAVIPGSGETGEIVAAGGNITLGYWNDPVETSKYFRNGRLHTGDIARVDSDGYIFIVEREREMIKSGGNRVSAKEVEDVIAELSEVVEVAVLGAPHELLGECIKAFVVTVPASGITPQDVKEQCRKRLSTFKIPEEVIFLNSMPHNSSGKILKPQLLAMLSAKASGEASAETDRINEASRTGLPERVAGRHHSK